MQATWVKTLYICCGLISSLVMVMYDKEFETKGSEISSKDKIGNFQELYLLWKLFIL